MPKIYYGCASGSARKVLKFFNVENVMINYATYNNQPWDGIKSLFIDSGGYSFFHRCGVYKDRIEDYLKYIDRVKPDFFATRDVPCEPEILKKWKLSVEANQKVTIENHSQILKLIEKNYPHLKQKLVVVLQGWEVDQYLNMIDKLKETGLLTDYIGIGSICRRGKNQVIRDIILQVRQALPRHKIHAFGVKANILQYPECRKALHSVDSLAYEFSQMYVGYPLSKLERMALSFLTFKQKLESLCQQPNTQHSLSTFSCV